VYLLTGCPRNGSIDSYSLDIESTAFNDNFIDTGNGIILKAAANDSNAKIYISVRDKTEVTYLKFQPEVFDLTTCLEIKKVITVDTLLDLLWESVNEGPFL